MTALVSAGGMLVLIVASLALVAALQRGRPPGLPTPPGVVPEPPRRGRHMRFEINDTEYCDTLHPTLALRCEGESGHAGEHVSTLWAEGEIQGPIYWDA